MTKLLSKQNKTITLTLIYASFVSGLCSIVYELLIATTAAYFLGDSVKYFSVTIGLYMAAMGLGSHCSKYIHEKLIIHFIYAELCLALLGGLSVPLLYLAYTNESYFIPTYAFLTLAIGFLIGLEIPFLTRAMEAFKTLQYNIANVLAFDYFGAVIATLAFPFLMLPWLGVYQSSLVIGLINISIGLMLTRAYRHNITAKQQQKIQIIIYSIIGILVLAILLSTQLLRLWDQNLYDDRIVYAKTTPYQHIVLTKSHDDVRLYLNGNIQFSQADEARYHDSLVHVPMALTTHTVRKVLLLGAGDGLAARELLKYPTIERIDLVELDPTMLQLSQKNPYLTTINQNSLHHRKVHLYQSDALTFLKQNENNNKYDFIIADLPDPDNESLARLYSKHFYQYMQSRLEPQGVFVTHATSPYYATKAYWSIVTTLRASGFQRVIPYHTLVPSFGEWGFVVASHAPLHKELQIAIETSYLSDDLWPAMQVFSKDMQTTNVVVNRLDKPILLSYYLEGWHNYR